jgi:hypothetical protein
VLVIAGGETTQAVPAWRLKTDSARSSRWRAALETGLIVAGFVVMFFGVKHQLLGDDLVRFHDIQELLDYGKLTNSPFSLVMPLAAVPVLELGNLTQDQAWWAAHVNVIFLAVGVVVAYLLLRGRFDPRLFRLTVLVLLGASFFTNRLRDWSVETFTSTLVAIGIICLATNRHVFSGWAAIVIGVVNTPAAIIGLGLLASWQAIRTRQLRHLLAVPAAAALIMLEAWIRRGGPFVTGYGKQGFTVSFVIGLVSILFSFGRGLIFFMPGLLLWLDPRRRLLPGHQAVAMMLVFTAGLVLVYSKWWAWYGGVSFGPRFFLFAAIPASILIAVGVWRAGQSAAADAVTLVVLAVSAWVALSGAIEDPRVLLAFCKADNFRFEPQCWYYPGHSSLWQVATQFPHLIRSNALAVAYVAIVFCYLAVPLAVSLARASLPRRSWVAGWHI